MKLTPVRIVIVCMALMYIASGIGLSYPNYHTPSLIVNCIAGLFVGWNISKAWRAR